MNIFVGNLALEITEDEVRKEFAVFGQVKSVTLMDDRCFGSGQENGHGYVEMTSSFDGATAIARLDGKMLLNRTISVIGARPLTRESGGSSASTRGSSRPPREMGRR